MKLLFLGTGSAFSLKNRNSSILIQKNGKNFLFDAGTDIRYSLHENNLSYKDIDALFISHAHADHCGGVEYLAFSSYFDEEKDKIKLFGRTDFLYSLWNESLKGGLKYNNLILKDYFDIKNLSDYFDNFIWENISFRFFQIPHIDGMLSFGLRMYDYDSDKSVFITGDSKVLNENWYNMDLIIHDCETSNYKSGVHAHIDDLYYLPNEIKSKMFLIHYQDNTFDHEWMLNKEQNISKDFFTSFKDFAYQNYIYDTITGEYCLNV